MGSYSDGCVVVVEVLSGEQERAIGEGDVVLREAFFCDRRRGDQEDSP